MNAVSQNTPVPSLFHYPERGGKPLEYVTVTTRLWKDRWVRGLGTDAKLLWLYLITHDSDYGFYEYDPEAWALETGLDTLVIENLLFSFEADGKVARDKDLILVVKALQHRRLSTRDYDYAVNAIRKRYSARSSRLVSLCVTMNPMDSSGVLPTPPLSVSESVSESDHKDISRAKPKRLRPERRSLADLEAELDPTVLPTWALFKDALARANKDGKVAESRLAGILEHIHVACHRDSISAPRLVVGLAKAVTNGNLKTHAPENYALAVARGSNE